MKAEMGSSGLIVIFPESTMEAYALSQWVKSAFIYNDDVTNEEQCYCRGSMIIVSTDIQAGEK